VAAAPPGGRWSPHQRPPPTADCKIWDQSVGNTELEQGSWDTETAREETGEDLTGVQI